LSGAKSFFRSRGPGHLEGRRLLLPAHLGAVRQSLGEFEEELAAIDREGKLNEILNRQAEIDAERADLDAE
jgi:hypothetical protein